MGIVTPQLPAVGAQTRHSVSILDKSNSMSQDYHHGIFSFSNGFERSPISQQQEQHHQHISHQIRMDKARAQGFEAAPPPLVGIEDEESTGGLPVQYETTGMLSEMFNFAPAGSTAAELLNPPNAQAAAANYRSSRLPPQAAGTGQDWYGQRHGLVSGFGPLGEAKGHALRSLAQQHHHHQINPSINADSAAAMQLFLMNPQARSPSPPPHHNHGSNFAPAASTLHMLLPNPSSTSLQGFTGTASTVGGGGFGQFTWVPDSTSHGGNATTSEIRPVVEGQGLSLSLSSSLQHLDVAKAEDLRMGDNTGFLYYNNQGHGGSGSSSTSQYPYKNLGSHNNQQQQLQLQGHVAPNQQVHVGFGSSSLGVVNVLRNSKYLKAAQELLEEFCSVGRGHHQFKKNKQSNPNSSKPSASTNGPSNSSKNATPPPLSAADRIEHQRRKVKLLAMLDEVDRRYSHYCEQMQMVVNSFDMVMGFGGAVPYTALAQKAMSRHFRCLKDAITEELKQSCELLGEKDGAGTSGITKGETPRLKLLEQSLRQQRTFHQMGMMDQEAWRPQRGLPERSVNILRAWLFEHFLHPYPSDADKHLLARQTGLSRNQVSNWFINARVRLWKPMVEEMYQQEAKDCEDGTDDEDALKSNNDGSAGLAQTPTSSSTQPLPSTTAMIQQTTTIPSTTVSPTPTGKRFDINATESDPPSIVAINRHCSSFSENQANHSNSSSMTTTVMVHTTTSEVVPPVSQCFPAPGHESGMAAGDTCRLGSMVSSDYGATSGSADVGSSLIRYGTSPGDVSLTLGLRHAGNTPEKSSAFSMIDFGGI